MKFLVLAVVTLASSLSLASGYVCEGQGYRVKMYNEVQPSLGTKNPAVLVVSSANGTIARLQGTEIEKDTTNDTTIFQGSNNAVDTGRFLSVQLEVVKQASTSGDFAGTHFAILTVNADGGTWTAKMACSEYLKGN